MTKDNAIDVMKNVHEETGVDIPFDLVEKCYKVEEEYLFEKDKTIPRDIMKKIVEAHIESQN